METIVFSSKVDDVVRRLERALAEVCAPIQTIVRSVQGSPESLCQVLRDAREEDVVGIVLVARNVAEMREIIAVESSLSAFRVILVIPESDGEVLTLGQELRPRLYVDIGDDFSEVASVIENINKRRRAESLDPPEKEWQ